MSIVQRRIVYDMPSTGNLWVGDTVHIEALAEC